MKIIIDIGHPAHVHLFKHLAWDIKKRGHSVLFTVRQKEMNSYLLEKYKFDFKVYGQSYKSGIRKIFGLLFLNFKLFRIIKEYSPDITISHGSFYLSQMSWLLNIKNITLEDTGNMEQIRLYKSFTNVILSPSCYKKYHGKKHLFYKGYHELSYLHPNKFKSDLTVLDELGVKKDEPYTILRFISWDASHDINHPGLSPETKFKAVKEFSKYGKVFISSQKKLPKEIMANKIPINPDKIHHAMAFAKLLWGESATMASEASVLGIPGVYLDNTGRFYTKDQETNYGLVFNFTESKDDQELAIQKGIELLQIDNLKKKWQNKRNRVLQEKIDVTAFLIWFIENYPNSFQIIKENPDYQNRFISYNSNAG